MNWNGAPNSPPGSGGVAATNGSGRGGRSNTNKEFLFELDLPPRLRRFKVLRDIYLMAQPPRLIQAGSSALNTANSFTKSEVEFGS